MKNFFTDIAYIIGGGLIWAVGLNTFLVPNLIASGGVVGLATVVNHFFFIPVGMMSILFNIPVFAASVKKMGWHFVLNTFFALLITSVIIDVSALFLPVFVEDKLFSAVLGGVCCGVGLGIIYSRGVATGGTDLIARLVDKVFPTISYGRLILILDAVVVVIAAVAFRDWKSALYSAIAIYIMGIVIDYILGGLSKGKLVFIISSREKEIGLDILQKLRRGATVINGKGCYTEQPRGVLMIVVRSFELHRLKEIVKTADEKAFVIVGDVSEITGQGFGRLE